MIYRSPHQNPSLSLHDALPISATVRQDGQGGKQQSQGRIRCHASRRGGGRRWLVVAHEQRSEEHTSELQSRFDLVCRLLLEKKKSSPNVFEMAATETIKRIILI